MSSSASPYECEMVGEYAVITLSESLNSVQWKAIDDIGGELVERLEALRKPACVVDLSKLNYMGSAMVALVVRMWKSLDARGGRLVVVNRDANVLEVLNLAGLTKVWTMTDSRDEALRLIGAGRGGHSSHGTGGDDSSAAIPAVIGLLLVLVACGALGMVLAGVMPEQRGPVVGVLFGAAGLGALLGLFAAARAAGGTQAIGIVAAVAGLVLVGYGVAGLPQGAPAGQAGTSTEDDAEPAPASGNEEPAATDEETGDAPSTDAPADAADEAGTADEADTADGDAKPATETGDKPEAADETPTSPPAADDTTP